MVNALISQCKREP